MHRETKYARRSVPVALPAGIARLRHVRGRSAVVYGVLAVAAAFAAYWRMFTDRRAYDDEGTMLVLLDAFVDGATLYQDIETSYGPFYFELFGGFFALTGTTVGTDASRLLVTGIWAAASVLLGIAAQRLTGRLVMGVAGMAVAFGLLGVLTAEPMHPVGISLLLLAALALAIASWPGDRAVPWGAAAGALIAAVALTKVNLGVFAVAAIVLAIATTVEPVRSRAWLRWPVAAGFVAMPFALMRADIDQPWVQDFVLIATAGAAALVIATACGRHAPDDVLTRWTLGAVAGAAGATVVVLGVLVAAGTSLGDAYQWLVVEAQTQRDVFSNPLRLHAVSTVLAVGAVAAALAAAVLPSRRRLPAPWPALGRLGAGAVLWLGVVDALPGPAAFQRVAIPLALGWVAALTPAGVTEGPARRFARVALPALAIAQTLQAYPVAASQVAAGALLFVPLGAICLHDGWRMLTAWSAEHPGRAVRLAPLCAAVAGALLFAGVAYDRIVRPTQSAATAYRDHEPLDLHGTELLRQPTERAATLRRVVQLIRENGCTTLVGIPSMNSFHLWSGVGSPRPLAPAWMVHTTDARQRQAVAAMRSSPRPCALRNDELVRFWLRDRPIPDGPLVRYLTDSFVEVERVGPYSFRLPRT